MTWPAAIEYANGVPASVDVAIIGAGPAGLAVGRQLARLHISHCVLERGAIGESWRSMPPALRLVSPWWTNALSAKDVFRHWPFSTVSAIDYADYLLEFGKTSQAALIEHCEVHGVSRSGQKFSISTCGEDVVASVIVCAGGYFSQPAAPDPSPLSDGSVPVIHASRYPGPEAVATLAQSRRVVIVGRRVSAGQLMVELVEYGLDVSLSVKSRVEFRRDGVVGAIKDLAYYFYEEGLMLFKPRLRAQSFPAMDGGKSRRLVETGRVGIIPPIAAISKGQLLLDDASQLEVGLVINATGYRPALSYLSQGMEVARDKDGLPECNDWESISQPGLFFIGLDNRRNYRSRTLRGIRSDCRGLAKQVQHRLHLRDSK